MKKLLTSILLVLSVAIMVKADTIMPVPFLSRISGGDTTPNYLFSKLVAGTGITLTKNNPGANETITITSASGSFSTTTINGVATTSFTFSTSTTGTDFNISTTTNTIIFNTPSASASNRGFLTPTDWNTFNNKGSGTVTAVSIATANGFSGSSSGGATPALTIVAGALTPTSIQTSTFLNASTTLGVTGATTLYSGLTGTTASFSSTLGVTGKTTLGVASTTAVTATDIYTTTNTVSGNQTTGGTLSVTGKTTLANASSTSLTVSGLSYLATSTVTGDLSVSGNLPNRVVGYTASSTITINVDTTDEATTTVNQTTTFANPTGTPIDGFMYMMTLTATGTRTIAWGTSFASSTGTYGIALPLTVASGTTKFLFEYHQFKLKYLFIGLIGVFE